MAALSVNCSRSLALEYVAKYCQLLDRILPVGTSPEEDTAAEQDCLSTMRPIVGQRSAREGDRQISGGVVRAVKIHTHCPRSRTVNAGSVYGCL